jgi:hypothetical protein
MLSLVVIQVPGNPIFYSPPEVRGRQNARRLAISAQKSKEMLFIQRLLALFRKQSRFFMGYSFRYGKNSFHPCVS